MQSFSNNSQAFDPLVNNLALYFQIRDDLINLISSSYHEHKSYCEDFTEGKGERERERGWGERRGKESKRRAPSVNLGQ